MLPLKTEIKQRVPRSPSSNYSFKLEITLLCKGREWTSLGSAFYAGLTNPLAFAADAGLWGLDVGGRGTRLR